MHFFYYFFIFICFFIPSSCHNIGDNQEESIGYQIRKARLTKGISQAELAQAIQIDQNALSLIEDGLATPTALKIVAMQDYLQVSFVLGKNKHIEDYLEE